MFSSVRDFIKAISSDNHDSNYEPEPSSSTIAGPSAFFSDAQKFTIPSSNFIVNHGSSERGNGSSGWGNNSSGWGIDSSGWKNDPVLNIFLDRPPPFVEKISLYDDRGELPTTKMGNTFFSGAVDTRQVPMGIPQAASQVSHIHARTKQMSQVFPKTTSKISSTISTFERTLSEYELINRPSPTVKITNPLEWLDKKTALEIIDYIQMELDYSEANNSHMYYRKCYSLLRYLCQKFQIMPLSLSVPGVKREDPFPVAGGGFSDVYRGKAGSKVVCLKVLRLFMESDETTRSRIRKQFLHEALVWRQLKHPNVLPLLGVSTDVFLPTETFCLISPWMSNGDVLTYLKKNPEHNVILALSEIANGLCYLHSRDPPIIHGDIRGANILVDDNSRCCLADFGLALIATQSQSWSIANSTGNSGKGATRWMAPEYLNSSKPGSLRNTSRDVYALGCTIVEILTQKMPFPEYRDSNVIFKVLKGERPPRPDNGWCTDELWRLTTRCWAQRSEDRPSINQVYADLKGLYLKYLPTTY